MAPRLQTMAKPSALGAFEATGDAPISPSAPAKFSRPITWREVRKRHLSMNATTRTGGRRGPIPSGRLGKQAAEAAERAYPAQRNAPAPSRCSRPMSGRWATGWSSCLARGRARRPTRPSRPRTLLEAGDRLYLRGLGLIRTRRVRPVPERCAHVGALPPSRCARLPRSCIGQDERQAGGAPVKHFDAGLNDQRNSPPRMPLTTAWPRLGAPGCRAKAFGKAVPNAVRSARRSGAAGWLVRKAADAGAAVSGGRRLNSARGSRAPPRASARSGLASNSRAASRRGALRIFERPLSRSITPHRISASGGHCRSRAARVASSRSGPAATKAGSQECARPAGNALSLEHSRSRPHSPYATLADRVLDVEASGCRR